MRSASRTALSAARDRLGALVPAAYESGGTSSAEQIAADLRAVAGILAREPSLRRALTDPARTSAARVGFASGLLGDRVGTAAAEVVTIAVEGRWGGPGDFATGVELLAVDAELMNASAQGKLADVEDEIFRFSRVVEGSPELFTVLVDAAAPAERRADVLNALLAGKAQQSTIRLVAFALTGVGGRTFDAALTRIVERAAQLREREVVYVATAAPMTEEQEERLARRLGAAYGKQVSVKAEVQPELLGGVTVRIGDDLYDGSVARRLAEARTEISSGR